MVIIGAAITAVTIMKPFKTYVLVAALVLFNVFAGEANAQNEQTDQNLDHLNQIDGQENSTTETKNHRWNYQPEESETGKYYQPAYTATLPLMVERNKMRIDSLEDRVEKLEKALTAAINTINAQSNILKKMNQ